MKYKAKPIEQTPILKGEDLADFIKSLLKRDSKASKLKRKAAKKSLMKARNK